MSLTLFSSLTLLTGDKYSGSVRFSTWYNFLHRSLNGNLSKATTADDLTKIAAKWRQGHPENRSSWQSHLNLLLITWILWILSFLSTNLSKINLEFMGSFTRFYFESEHCN